MEQKPILRIAENQDFSPEVVRHLRQWFEVVMHPCQQNELKEVLEECDIFWFRLGFQIHADLFSEKTRCRILATPVTGIDHIDESACRKNGIRIICLRGEKEFLKEVRATAEMTIGLTLALLRNLAPASIDVQNGFWRRDLFRGREIYKKTVGIVGVGRLGKITAEYFKAMGAKVIGYDIHDDLPDWMPLVPSLEILIKNADIVSLHVSYNQSTHHLFDQHIFNFFDEHKILVNTSRGGLIDEDALLSALQNNRIGGAALDVIQREAEVNEHFPIVQYAKNHSNLLIVPHIGGNTYESFEKTEWFIAKKIKEAFFQSV